MAFSRRRRACAAQRLRASDEGRHRQLLFLCPGWGLIRLPVARHRNVPGHLNRSRLEIVEDKLQGLAGLGGDPVRDVVLVDRDGTDRRPAKKTLVPQGRIGRQIVLLNVARGGQASLLCRNRADLRSFCVRICPKSSFACVIV